MKLAMIMDPIEHINIKKDTSFAILLEAQKRGFNNFYVNINTLALKDSKPYALCHAIKVKDNKNKWFNLATAQTKELNEFDVIFMRKDPPVDQLYWHATQILTFVNQQQTQIINNPQSLLNFNEKLLAFHFPRLCPPSLITAKKMDLIKFIHKFATVICKPLDGMGGHGVFHLHKHDPNLNVSLELLTNHWRTMIVCQRYLPEIKKGDKRIHLINGEPMPYALNRIPPKGEIRANLAAGGTGKAVKLNANDYR